MAESLPNPKENVVDKAANAASSAVDATKGAASAALDSVSNKVESVRSTLSPALDNAMRPFDSLEAYTKAKPLASLACAFATGAVLSAVLVSSRRSSRY